MINEDKGGDCVVSVFPSPSFHLVNTQMTFLSVPLLFSPI